MSIYRALRAREASSSPAAAAQRAAEHSDDLVQRLVHTATLTGHSGCVNTVSFDPTGELLTSGSDDGYIILHNWQTGGSTVWELCCPPVGCSWLWAALHSRCVVYAGLQSV